MGAIRIAGMTIPYERTSRGSQRFRKWSGRSPGPRLGREKEYGATESMTVKRLQMANPAPDGIVGWDSRSAPCRKGIFEDLSIVCIFFVEFFWCSRQTLLSVILF